MSEEVTTTTVTTVMLTDALEGFEVASVSFAETELAANATGLFWSEITMFLVKYVLPDGVEKGVEQRIWAVIGWLALRRGNEDITLDDVKKLPYNSVMNALQEIAKRKTAKTPLDKASSEA